MDIKYLGHSSFRIRGKSGVVVTDPFDSKAVGLPFPSTDATIVTVSREHAAHNNIEAVKPKGEEDIFVVRGPGEYEISGIRIFGYRTFSDKEQGAERGANTMYRIEVDGVSILHCGNLGHALTDAIRSEINGADILMVPTGGHLTINEKEAAKLVTQIEPSIVIPMHYGRTELLPAYAELTGVDEFLKAMDKQSEPKPKLSVSKDSLPSELEIVVLE